MSGVLLGRRVYDVRREYTLKVNVKAMLQFQIYQWSFH
jgi:hypothetical protein